MSLYRLDLHLREGDVPVLHAAVRTERGSWLQLQDLDTLRADVPGPLAEALGPGGPLRHRVTVPRPGGRQAQVRGLALRGEQLIAVLDALVQLLRASSRAEDPLAALLPVLEAGRGAQIDEQVMITPELIAALIRDLHAQRLVRTRRLRIDLGEQFGEMRARWLPLEEEPGPLLGQLVDARARRAFAHHLARAPFAADGEPLDLLPGLAGSSALRADLPALRAAERAVDAYLDSGRARVALQSTDNELVVRLFEPSPGAAGAGSLWPLQTCLREADGTVHPVAVLQALGDVSATGAIEASAEVMRLAPVVRQAAVDETGVDWLLTTAQASDFLSHDAPALEAAGVTVLLPREWTRMRTTLMAEASEEPPERRPQGTGVGIQAMASFRWKLAVGDLELTEEEIEEIREAQAELVQLRGRWVRLDRTTLRAAETFLDRFAAQARRRGDVDGLPAFDPERLQRLHPRAGKPVAPGSADLSAGVTGSPGARAGDEVRTDWASLFALLISGEADQVDVSVSRVVHGGGGRWSNSLGRLLPGGAGAVGFPPPPTLRAVLRPYQVAGLNWMWALHELGLGGILADDMGLGKTMQVLALLVREREDIALLAQAGTGAAGQPEEGPALPIAQDDALHERLLARHRIDEELRPGPTLLVCPMSVVGSWQREARTFAPQLAVHVHHGGDRIRDESFGEGAMDMDLVITTYSLLARDLAVLQQVPWQRIVFDEAQHLKNRGTAVSAASRRIEARHRLALTGTPVENRLADLHSLMDVVNPGVLGPSRTFQEAIAQPIEDEGDSSALSRLRWVTAPFILRRVKTDRSIISDLPEKVEMTTLVNLTAEQAGLYEALVAELMTQIDGADEKQRRTLVTSTLTRLKQVCNHPAHYLGDGSAILRAGEHRSGKLEVVDTLLENAFAEGEKVLLFTQFTTFGHMLVPYWRERFGLDIPFLHGGVAKQDRDTMVAEFQAAPDAPGAMLLSLRAGGTGITLTAANHVVHLDRWWNPAVENQATDRAFRIGQRKDVQVRKLVSAGTVEERIDQVLADKQGLADLTIAPGEGWLADLDDRSLLGLLAYIDPEAPPQGGREGRRG
ncbi:DEAD/DEAH box helicase [Brachybacterium hainanense]|uniref:SNF2-related protein n=1 Tax=Brachybacterium hainanense TaxID=1541174 RepID=A0ABV6R7A1_9MICO